MSSQDEPAAALPLRRGVGHPPARNLFTPPRTQGVEDVAPVRKGGGIVSKTAFLSCVGIFVTYIYPSI